MVEHKRKSSIDKHFAPVKHNYRAAELQAGHQTTRQITMTQAMASSAERIKNQLFTGPILSVFVLLINVFFSDNLTFNNYSGKIAVIT